MAAQAAEDDIWQEKNLLKNVQYPSNVEAKRPSSLSEKFRLPLPSPREAVNSLNPGYSKKAKCLMIKFIT